MNCSVSESLSLQGAPVGCSTSPVPVGEIPGNSPFFASTFCCSPLPHMSSILVCMSPLDAIKTHVLSSSPQLPYVAITHTKSSFTAYIMAPKPWYSTHLHLLRPCPSIRTSLSLASGKRDTFFSNFPICCSFPSGILGTPLYSNPLTTFAASYL